MSRNSTIILDSQAWHVNDISFGDFFAGKTSEDLDDRFYGAFSILKHAIRPQNQIAEIMDATGERLLTAAKVRPRRMAFYNTVATIVTEVKIEDEEKQKHVINQLYNDNVKPLIKEMEKSGVFHTMLEDISTEVKTAIGEYKSATLSADHLLYGEIHTAHTIIAQRIAEGKYTPGTCSPEENADSILEKVVTDRVYDKRMTSFIEETTEREIARVIDDGPLVLRSKDKSGATISESVRLERFTPRPGEARQSYMMAGAPASGKGTSLGMYAVEHERMGRDWADVVKIDTDSFRNLVSSADEIGGDNALHTIQNNDEASAITLLAYKKYQKKLESATGAPDILIDCVSPTDQRIEIGATRGANLKLICVTCPPKKTVVRAFFRGKTTGRFCQTTYQLASHKAIPKRVEELIIANRGRNINFKLVNSDVPLGELPQTILTANLRENTLTVHNLEAYGKFLALSTLDHTATSAKDLKIKTNYLELAVNSIGRLKKAGYTVTIEAPTTQEKGREAKESRATIPNKLIQMATNAGKHRASKHLRS